MSFPSGDYGSLATVAGGPKMLPFDQGNAGLIPFKIRNQYFEEYLGLTPLTVFMGTSPNDAIQIFEMNNGDGMSYRVGFRKELDYSSPIIGFNQAAGSEQQVTIYSDEIRLELLRFADSLMGVPFVRKMTPIDVFEALRPLLINAQQRYLIDSIIRAATTDIHPDTDAGKFNGHRCLAGGVTFANTNGKKISEITPTENLTVNHIRKLKNMAVQGGATYEAESRIKPITLRTRRGFPEELYLYLIDPETYTDLVKDTNWSQFVYRGVIQGEDQPEGISGSRYRGMVEGVLIYECPELSKIRPAATKGWNLFLGAQAMGLCWSRRPWFEMESRDFNLNQAMAVCEIRGQKAFQYPSFVDVTKFAERGIIHSLVKIGA